MGYGGYVNSQYVDKLIRILMICLKTEDVQKAVQYLLCAMRGGSKKSPRDPEGSSPSSGYCLSTCSPNVHYGFPPVSQQHASMWIGYYHVDTGQELL